ncbi:hypothetical protein MIR68_006017 [Amoeboaphelidium protococcarum]|nr:hypothetical protein MIR68_006017 [Amoeboaphelidium protococcarum]
MMLQVIQALMRWIIKIAVLLIIFPIYAPIATLYWLKAYDPVVKTYHFPHSELLQSAFNRPQSLHALLLSIYEFSLVIAKTYYAVGDQLLFWLGDFNVLRLCVDYLKCYSDYWNGVVVIREYQVRDDNTDILLDVYKCAQQQQKSNGPSRVLIFVYGGAWSSGTKSTYFQLGVQLCKELKQYNAVIIPQYDVYPNVRIESMVRQVRDSIIYVREMYGGSCKIDLMAHSAGCHIALWSILNSAVRVPKLHNLILLAGVYDINQHYDYEKSRYVHNLSGMCRSMGSTDQGMLKWSLTDKETIKKLHDGRVKEVHILHGAKDFTVPIAQSVLMADLLQQCSVKCNLITAKELDHSAVILSLISPLWNTSYSAKLNVKSDGFNSRDYMLQYLQTFK